LIIAPDKLIQNINDLIFEWQKCGLVYDSRNHKGYVKSKGVTEVTWGNDGFILKDQEFSTISEYCALIENKQYSILLNDGSFFQISYSLKRNKIIKHRLCWYPSPIRISTEDLQNSNISDLILDKMDSLDLNEFKNRSPIRFDYAPDQKSEEHAEVHLHINEESCRIPVKSPLCLRKFICFIINNFYEDIKKLESLYKTANTWSGIDTLTAGQKAELHINIFTAITD
jgi:hypothetical protein